MSVRGTPSRLDRPRGNRGPRPRLRVLLVVVLMGLAAVGLVARAVDLQLLDNDFYQAQGNERFLRTVPIPVSRGTIFDRHGIPLAVSTPVKSLWANPQKLLQHMDRIPQLAKALNVDAGKLRKRLLRHSGKEFVYLRRQMNPAHAKIIMDLDIPGVHEQREYKRFYPSGSITAHVLGFTNIDGKGQEGLELSYNKWLTGKPGAKKVIRAGNGRIVENVEQVRAPQPGRDLTLSIDRRIQYLTWRELTKTMKKFRATSAAMIVMNPRNGEILSMVSLPSYNPNDLDSSTAAERRNRAATDVFEPGSTAKTIAITAALESGKWTPTSTVNTGRGVARIAGHIIHDDDPNGVIDVTHVITRSSNIGAAKIALSLDRNQMYGVYRAFGFGSSTRSGFPGEASGFLPISRNWRPIRQATIAYGYGFNVTLLQLAQAYSVIADGGILHHPTFIKGVDNAPKRVVSKHVAHQMVKILETVVEDPRGTAHRTARIPFYTAAGKTGTSHMASDGGYKQHVYNSLFAGMAPASDPRLVGVVVVRGSKGAYFGTQVAAPVFKSVMEGALRLLDVSPDRVDPKVVINGEPGASSNIAMSGGVQ